MADHTIDPLQDEIFTMVAATSSKYPHVADTQFDKEIRIVALYVEIVLGTVGGVCVLAWLWYSRRRRSRINAIICNVVASDLLVICFASLMQLIWEYVDREWRAGDAMCRLLKWGQSFALMSSNNMLVVLSVDRHQAIRAPLRAPFSVLKMASTAWGVAGLLSLPQFAVFRLNIPTEGPLQNKTVCESVFRYRPMWHRQAYLTFIGLVVFYIPLFVILACYVRIFTKISRKTAEASAGSMRGGLGHERPSSTSLTSTATTWTNNKRCNRWSAATAGPRHLTHQPTSASTKVRLQMSTKSTSLPKAKAKTLKMTVVIVASFIVSGLPYHVYELILSYGDHTSVSRAAGAVLGALAVANSVTNPFVFLAFNASAQCVRRLVQTTRGGGVGGRGGGGTRRGEGGVLVTQPSIGGAREMREFRGSVYSAKTEMTAAVVNPGLEAPVDTRPGSSSAAAVTTTSSASAGRSQER